MVGLYVIFQERNPNEILVKFKPSGDPYGFYQKLGEDEPGDSLGRDSAYAVAIKNLSPDWNIDLSNYKLIDESEKIKPNGRIDHQFVFKRKDINIGDEGSIRLRLSVSGDKLTEINHYIEVPEGFKRRFSEMRSSNDMIAFFCKYVYVDSLWLTWLHLWHFYFNKAKANIMERGIKMGFRYILYSIINANKLPTHAMDGVRYFNDNEFIFDSSNDWSNCQFFSYGFDLYFIIYCSRRIIKKSFS